MDLRDRPVTPDKPTKYHSDTVARARFYDAYDNNAAQGGVPARRLFRQLEIPQATANRWLLDRNRYGPKAYRRSDLRQYKSSITNTQRAGRPPKVPIDTLHEMLRNPKKSRQKRLTTQLKDVGISASTRTVQRALRHDCNAGMCKAAHTTLIQPPQAAQRTEYTRERRFYHIEGYWDGVVFTDEAHMSLNDYPQQWILRVFGERYNPENIVEKPDYTPVCVHFAAWINWYEKADDLTFYNDEYDDVQPVKPPLKPRRRPTTETEAQYRERVAQWDAEKARIPQIIRPGNSMRASYYTKKILPGYCDALRSLQSRSDELRSHIPPENRYNWYIVEDNDPSHGTRNLESLPARYREKMGIKGLPHPANSPDLNPIEGIWLIIKERVRQRLDDINSIDELKQALQYEWKQVSITDIREGILEMQFRCGQVFEHPGVRVKTGRW